VAEGTLEFNTIGHIGKLGGPKSWMEPVNPLIAKQEFRLKLPALRTAMKSSFTSSLLTPAMAMTTTS